MEKEKILFLSLAHIIYLKPEEVKSVYEKYCQKLGLDFKTYSFSALQTEFDYKVRFSMEESKLEFTHPSYEEGVVASWNRVEVKSFLIELLAALVKDDQSMVRGSCGLILVKDFADLSFKDEAKKIIHLVLHDKNAQTRAGVAQSIEHFSAEMPIDIVLDCLETMRKDKHREIRATAINVIARNLFARVPNDKVVDFLSQGLEDRAAWVRLITVGAVRANMKILPEKIVLRAISCCKDLTHYSGWLISYFAWLSIHTFEEDFANFKKGKEKT